MLGPSLRAKIGRNRGKKNRIQRRLAPSAALSEPLNLDAKKRKHLTICPYDLTTLEGSFRIYHHGNEDLKESLFKLMIKSFLNTVWFSYSVWKKLFSLEPTRRS
jgi:hypothetical protein